jgi:hypothetical protein
MPDYQSAPQEQAPITDGVVKVPSWRVVALHKNYLTSQVQHEIFTFSGRIEPSRAHISGSN